MHVAIVSVRNFPLQLLTFNLLFFYLILQNKFHVKPLNHGQMMAALYLQVSVISQALIFVTRSRSWSFVERPGLLLLGAFLIAQLVRLRDKVL